MSSFKVEHFRPMVDGVRAARLWQSKLQWQIDQLDAIVDQLLEERGLTEAEYEAARS